MNSAIICLGSNAPDKRSRLEDGLRFLSERIGTVVASSGCYPTEAEDAPAGSAPYLNEVVEIRTDISSASQLIAAVKEYERNCGKTPEAKIKGSVSIDLDIIVWNGVTIRPEDYSREYFRKGLSAIATI